MEKRSSLVQFFVQSAECRYTPKWCRSIGFYQPARKPRESYVLERSHAFSFWRDEISYQSFWVFGPFTNIWVITDLQYEDIYFMYCHITRLSFSSTGLSQAEAERGRKNQCSEAGRPQNSRKTHFVKSWWTMNISLPTCLCVYGCLNDLKQKLCRLAMPKRGQRAWLPPSSTNETNKDGDESDSAKTGYYSISLEV